MSASPIKPSALEPITSGATACDHLAELSNTRTKMQQFLEWLLADDETGLLGAGFKEALIQQMLFDAAKKGWFVRTNATTGYLELVEKVPLTGIDGSTAADGDYLRFNGTNWVKTTPIYAAPTSGGTTVPAPSDGGILSASHGFSARPKQYRCDLVCTATDAGYAVGDTVDAVCLIQRGAGGETRPGCTVGVNGALVFAVFVKEGSSTRKYFLPNKGSFEITDNTDAGEIDPSKWDVYLYAMP